MAAARIWGIILLTITIFSICFPAQAQYSGGTGEPNDPYQIATAEDLIALGEEPNDYDKHFILTADIDLDPNLPGRKVFDKAVIAPDMNDVEDSFQGTTFTGVFDGNGHSISHLTITGESYLGLFGQLDYGVEIYNLGLEAVDVNGIGDHVGGLVGSNCRGSSVANCYSTGAVNGNDHVGGLVGYNAGSITSDYSALVVTGKDNIGGLVGYNWRGNIYNSYSTCAVIGDEYVGGLVGGNGGSITLSYSSGSVVGNGDIGGLVGFIIGFSGDWDDSVGGIANCYSTASVSGDSSVGGLVGFNDSGDIKACYSTGNVSGEEWVGGLIGVADYDFYYGDGITAFWDMETSGQASSNGGTGKTTAEMQTEITFTDAGWDFVGETDNGPNDVWKIVEGLTYPLLSWQKYSGGTGEPQDPYHIATAEDLIALGNEPNDYYKHFILIDDIDLAGYVFDKAVIGYGLYLFNAPCCNHSFAGVFDGNGHVISHLTITGGEQFVGLFAWLTGEVKNLGVVDVNIVSSSRYVGGLVGVNLGSISQCYSTGTVTGHCVGGLVGGQGNTNEGASEETIIANCFSTCEITGDSDVGGLVGENCGGGIIHCYSTGAVRGTGYYIGGLIGSGWSNRVTASFWDIETSGQTESAGVTGKTTTEMQTIDTFLEAGWDFVRERTNGLHEIWQMPEGGGYPLLAIFNGYTPPQLRGLGTVEDPYQIRNAAELGAMIHYDPRACYRLAAPIDLSGMCWSTAVIPLFGGTFDGSHLTIRNLTISGRSHLGLFGRLESGAKVKELAVVDVNIVGSGYSAGSLVGRNDGSIIQCCSRGLIAGNEDVGGLVGENCGDITKCYSTGTVDGIYYVGGLVGYNRDGDIGLSYSTSKVSGEYYVGGLVGVNWGTIIQCYSTGAVSGDSDVGGLVGYNGFQQHGTKPGIVIQCYSTGSVKGDIYIGGLVGQNAGTVTECYSSGTVSKGGGLVGYNYSCSWNEVIGCFWDTQTSGLTSSDGGSGKTTAEMKTAKTFTDADWDFVDETANGTEDIWSICEGTNYPRFVWQISPADFVCPDGITLDDFYFFIDYLEDVNCDSSNGYCDGTDLDFSGTVDIYDLAIMVDYWLAEVQ